MKNTNNQSNTPLYWAINTLSHTVAVLVIAGLMLLPYINNHALNIFIQSAQDGLLQTTHWLDILTHLFFAAMIWGLGFYIYRRVQKLRRERRTPTRFVRQASGIVLLETIIVMPVFLLLVMGIAQLALLNIASALTNLATFNAARVVWIWDGEPGCGTTCVRDKAKIQASLILAPVVAGDFGSDDCGSESPEFVMARGIMVGSQRPWPTTDMGKEGMDSAQEYLETSNYESKTSVITALDGSGFPIRTARKLTFAYCTVDVTYSKSGGHDGSINVIVEYNHFIGIPIIQALFGDLAEHGGRSGYYRVFDSSMALSKLRRANRNRAPTGQWEQGLF